VEISCKALWQNVHSSRPRINPELLLVSGFLCTTWFVLCPLMFLVEVCGIISNKLYLIYERALTRKTIGWRFAEQTIETFSRGV